MATLNVSDPSQPTSTTGNFFSGAPQGGAAFPGQQGSANSVGGQTVENLPAASKSSSMFPNLQKYVDANQGVGSQLGQQVENNINQQAQSFQQGVNKAQNNLGQQANQLNTFFQNSTSAAPNSSAQTPVNEPIAAGSQGFLQSVADRAGQGLTNQEYQNFQGLANGQFGQNFLNQDYTAGLQSNGQQLSNLANQTRTETGRADLLQQALNQPQYSRGQGILDSVILGTNAPTLQHLQNTAGQQAADYKQSLNNLGLQQGSARNQIGQDINGAQNQAQALLTGNNGAITNLTSDLNSRVLNAQNAASAQFSDLAGALRQGHSIDPASLTNLGVTGDLLNQFNALYGADIAQAVAADQAAGGGSKVGSQQLDANGSPVNGYTSPLSFDFSKYLTGPDLSKINVGNVATDKDYARYGELAKLAQLQPTLLSGNGKGVAGTASGIGASFNGGGAIQDARSALSKGANSDQYSQYVSAINSMRAPTSFDAGAKQQLDNAIANKNPLVLANPALMAQALSQGGLSAAARGTLQTLPPAQAQALQKALDSPLNPMFLGNQFLGSNAGGTPTDMLKQGLNNANPLQGAALISDQVHSLLPKELQNSDALNNFNSILNQAGHGFDSAGNFVQNLFGGGGGGGGKVICTELHAQGLLSDEVYEKDQAYGRHLQANDPACFYGYHIWAKPVVRLMQKSSVFSRIMLFLVEPWTREIAGHSNWRGRLMHQIGKPLCRLVYKLSRIGKGSRCAVASL